LPEPFHHYGKFTCKAPSRDENLCKVSKVRNVTGQSKTPSRGRDGVCEEESVSCLARVEFDDELLVDNRRDFVAGRDARVT
jgi:hypothetical protein